MVCHMEDICSYADFYKDNFFAWNICVAEEDRIKKMVIAEDTEICTSSCL